MSNVQSVLFSFHHLRDCPDAAQRKKIKKILKEGMKARLARQCGRAGQSSATAQASAQTSEKVNDNADSICWFCHADVSNLANNKCAGCRKVTTHLSVSKFLNQFLFQARYCDKKCQRADWKRHGDYCTKMQEKIRKKIEAKKAEKDAGEDQKED